MLGGGGQTSYEEVCSATGLDAFSSKTNDQYFWWLYDAAEKLMEESTVECHSWLDMQTHNGFQDIISLFDGAWLHRELASQHGSTAIVDVNFGCILWIGHRSKDTSKSAESRINKTRG